MRRSAVKFDRSLCSTLLSIALFAGCGPLFCQGAEDNSANVPSKKTAPSPEAALEAMTTPDDLRVELVLAEPIVRQPVFINFDERGRLWVVQYLQYPAPAGLKVLSRDNYWRALYDKTPPPPPHHFRGEDRITIHEDTNGDGRFDHHKTFLEGLNIVTAVARGRGGVWVLNPPYLLFYPDRDSDDVPDGDPEVHLSGFGLEDTHSVVNSLCWGPDGWLYAAQGSTVSGHVLRPGLDKDPLHSMGQAIWRYHPEERRYEIFAEGGGNAFGVEIDSKGRVFSGHNGGDTRGFHYMQGAYLQKGFDKHGPLSNPYSFGYFPAMKHNQTPRFTHNFIVYEAEALPERYRGKLFGIAPLLNHVVLSDVEAEGSTYRTKDIEQVLKTSDRFFRPVDIKLGADGAVYLADWCDGQVAHTLNQEGQIDKSDGRIYRLVPATLENKQQNVMRDLSKLSSVELVQLLNDPNRWRRQTALRLLADRKDAALIPLLDGQLKTAHGQLALETLWALAASGGLRGHRLLAALEHAEPFVRLWAVRLACDATSVDSQVARRIAELAASEPHVEVRAQLACSARRLPAAECLAVVRTLLEHAEDADDPRLPLLLWWAIESKCERDRDEVLKLFAEPAVWDLAIAKRHLLERLMRRFAAAGSRQDLLTCVELLRRAPTDDQRRELMKGFEAAYAGRTIAGLPDELVAAIDRFAEESPLVGLRQGRAESVRHALQILEDESGDATTRLQYVQVLGEVHQPAAIPVLLNIGTRSTDNSLRSAALLSLRRYNDGSIPRKVIDAYANMTDDVRLSALALLVCRAEWARELLDAVEANKIDRATMPAEIVLELRLHRDKELQERVTRMFPGSTAQPTGRLREEVQRLLAVVAAQPGTPKAGRELFAQHCARCHTLFGKGGNVGPELTTYPRHDAANLLLHIVDPSAEIRESYGSSIATMSDGRQLTGVVVDQDKQILVLRGADGKESILARSEIEELEGEKLSLMPEGLLNRFTDEQVRDLFAYLRSSQPVIDK